MAVLPSPDAVGQIADNPPRRTGIGTWQPDDISRAANQEGQSLERLGSTVGSVGEEIGQSADRIQLAQGLGSAHAALAEGHGALPSVTDPSQVMSADPSVPAPFYAGVGTKIDAARNMISNPRVRAEFDAQMQPAIAQFGAATTSRGRAINNDTGIASLQTNTDTIISKAAALDDENAASSALDGVKAQLRPLVASGALTNEQGNTFAKQAAQQFSEARYKVLLGQAEQTRDYTKLNAFLGSNAGGFGAGASLTFPGGANDNGPSSGPVSTPAGLAAYKQTTAKIESASGTNEGPLKSYYQFEPGTWALHAKPGDTKGTAAGEDGPMNRLTAKNSSSLLSSLGREPTPAEVYLAHQQGAGGAAALISNPNTPAGQLVPPANIRSNGGDPNAPAAQFVALWQNKYAKAAGQPGVPFTPVAAASSGMPAPGAPSVAAASAYRAGLLAGTSTPPPDQVASIGPVGLPVAPPIGAGSTTGILPADANPVDTSASLGQRAPPSTQWPEGAQSVVANADGSLSYAMTDGTYKPIPRSTATGAPHPQVPTLPPNSILNLLPPEKRASIQLEGIQAITRMQREDAMANQKDTRGDIASINNSVKQMVSGLPLSEAAWAPLRSQFANSADPQTRYTFAVADATRNTLMRFQGSSPQDVAAAVANMQSDYEKQVNSPGGDPNGVLGQVLEASKQYLQTYRQGVNQDPLGRAAMAGVIGGKDGQIKSIDPASPTLSQDVADRVVQAKAAAKMFGMDASPTFLRPEDRVALRKVAQAGGDPMVNLAKGIVQGAGADAPAIFRQISKEAPPLEQIGQWAMDPNADHSTQIRRYADTIAAWNDPVAAKNLPRVDEKVMRSSNVADPLADAASEFSQDSVGRLRNTANVLASESAFTGHYDPKSISGLPTNLIPDSYHEAVGGTRDKDGNMFGGITKVNGAWFSGQANGYSAIVPTNMRQDMFNTAIGQINQSDVDKMGPPPVSTGSNSGLLSAEDIKKGKFVAVPDDKTGTFSGKYRVQLPDPTQDNSWQPVLNQNGKPWVFDMGRAQQNGLGDRVPGAFKPPTSAPTPTVPAGPIGPQPGLVEAGNIDLAHRPIAKNADGSISTVRSMSFEEGGKEVLVPTVVGGKVVSDEEAKQHYKQTGEHLGKFDSPASADAYAERLHQAQSRFYKTPPSPYRNVKGLSLSPDVASADEATIPSGNE